MLNRFFLSPLFRPILTSVVKLVLSVLLPELFSGLSGAEKLKLSKSIRIKLYNNNGHAVDFEAPTDDDVTALVEVLNSELGKDWIHQFLDQDKPKIKEV